MVKPPRTIVVIVKKYKCIHCEATLVKKFVCKQVLKSHTYHLKANAHNGSRNVEVVFERYILRASLYRTQNGSEKPLYAVYPPRLRMLFTSIYRSPRGYIATGRGRGWEGEW